MNEFVSQFLIEARELAEQASADLLVLEQRPDAPEHIDSVFRAFHTLKGAAGIMEYKPMERMLHRAEDALQDVRSGSRQVTPAMIDGCLACIGQIMRWTNAIEATGELPADADVAASKMIALLEPSPASVGKAATDSSWASDLKVWAEKQGRDLGEGALTAIRYEPDRKAFFRGDDPAAEIAALPGLAAVRVSARQPWPSLDQLEPFDCNLILEALSRSPLAEIKSALPSHAAGVELVELPSAPVSASASLDDVAASVLAAQKDYVLARSDAAAFTGRLGSAAKVVTNVLGSMGRDQDAERIGAAARRAIDSGDGAIFAAEIDALSRSIGGSSVPAATSDVADRRDVAASAIRVDVDKIDAIVDLTGELLVVKNAIGHWMRLAAENGASEALVAGLRTQHARLDRHVAELQRAVLDLRVLPLGRVFGRFPLLVRETAAKLGKQIIFRTEGDDTEADKAVVEALFEPLLHVVRNAIDHGIETTAEREGADKPPRATIVMRGAREDEHVIVEVSDDGRGVDVANIRRLAVSRGLATAEAVEALNDDEAVGLIFAPGFSTAANVTDLSGRGVGMNAVRSSIDRLGGDVAVSNVPGQGLTVRFQLPFTVMMTRVMTVEAGGQVFGIPFDAVLETVRIRRSEIRALGAGRAFVLRDQTIPVLDLAASLGMSLNTASDSETVCVVIAWAAGQRVGLEIDRPGERLDMMLKPIEGILAGMPAVSGTSLLGDGRVLIVLDLGALFA